MAGAAGAGALERALQVEIPVQRARVQREPVAAGPRRPRPGAQPRQQPLRECPRPPAQGRIGGDRKVGQERDPLIRIVSQQGGDGVLLDATDRGGDGGEVRVGRGQPVSAERAAGGLGDRRACLGRAQRRGSRTAVTGLGGGSLPGVALGRGSLGAHRVLSGLEARSSLPGVRAASSSSAITSSAVRPWSS